MDLHGIPLPLNATTSVKQTKSRGEKTSVWVEVAMRYLIK